MTVWGVDIGHTRLKWAILSPVVTPAQARVQFHHFEAEGYDHFSEVFLDRIWGSLVPPQVLWVADVCQVTPLLKAWVAQRWGSEVVTLTSEAAFGGVISGYQKPEILGIDRWLDLLGAWALYPQETSLVIDAGTYITADLLLESGQHAGGVIVPGLMPSKLFCLGHTTQACLAAGAEVLSRGFVPQVIQEVQKTVPHLKNVILTGGDAPHFEIKSTNTNCVIEPHLLWEGLRCRMVQLA